MPKEKKDKGKKHVSSSHGQGKSERKHGKSRAHSRSSGSKHEEGRAPIDTVVPNGIQLTKAASEKAYKALLFQINELFRNRESSVSKGKTFDHEKSEGFVRETLFTARRLHEEGKSGKCMHWCTLIFMYS
jgi:hypothetical protein